MFEQMMAAAGRRGRGVAGGAAVAMGLLLSACETVNTAPAADVTMRRVDVGGYALQGALYPAPAPGAPTVVFVNGLGEPMATWRSVPLAVRGFARVVLYDRGGTGASDAAPGARTADDVARELHAFLERADVRGPYVLVGHSIAGLHLQRFTARYPGEVAGLVFVDPTPAALVEQIAAALPPGVTITQFLTGAAAEMGLTGGARQEFLDQVTSAQQVAAGGPLPDRPVRVLTSMKVAPGGSAAEREGWFAMHAQLVAGLPRGVHTGTTRAGHHIHHDEPALVIEAIRAVATAGR